MVVNFYKLPSHEDIDHMVYTYSNRMIDDLGMTKEYTYIVEGEERVYL